MTVYNKLLWEDFIAQYPNRFKVTDNGNGTVTIEDDPGDIIQNGTPVNAVNLNRIEDGIYNLHLEDQHNVKVENNLSDIADKTLARQNLGIGTAALKNTGDYLEASKVLSDLPNKEMARTNLGLGTMATETANNYLPKSGNLYGLSSLTQARTNLGLKNAATKTVTFSTSVPSASEMVEGDLWFVYS